ncbi:MAG TPA: beta-ketoacyl synthase N-terminal-like domain-containing protein [Conexibacter sp.]|jgi:iturin family lipopeptide synthetase A|nr:beta-ketoacyl synthase N-terminal-like domain-containing protein [Conexibacter sp.]
MLPDDTLEWRLFDATQLLDLVVRRRAAPGGRRIVAYAVPQPDGDLAAVRRWLAAQGEVHGLALLPLLVDRIPRTAGGEVDDRALERLPVLDASRLGEHERALRAQPGLDGVVLRVERAAPPPPPRGDVAPARAGAPAHAVGPTIPLPADAPATLGEALVESARRHPAHAVIAYDQRGEATTLSYPELLGRGLHVAGGLRELGIAPGELVLLQAPELPDYFPALWGCLLAGARPVTLLAPPGYEQRSPTLDKLHAAWSASGRPWIVAAGAAVAGLRGLDVLYGDGAPRIADAGACADAAPLDGPLDGGEVALMQLSSGTTGRSKLIQIGYRAIPSLLLACQRELGLADDHVSLNWLPLDHVVGLVMHHLRDVVVGATNVHVPTPRVIADPLRWLDLLERHGVQHTFSPNFGYRLVGDALAEAPARTWDLSGVRTFVNGAEQCTLPVVERFLQATARFGVQPGQMRLAWGMAELGTVLTFKRFDEPGAVRRAGAGTFLSMGPPNPNSELRVVGPDDAQLREREIGRLLARTERLTPGYLVDGAVQRVADADGWFDTGDLAFLEDGELVVTGRAKEVISINGANLFAHEVEDAASGLAGVADGLVAACGVPDATSGTEALAVLYVAAPEAPREQLEARIRGAVTRATGIAPALVRAVAVAQFARTTSGKVQRTLLRERLLSGELGPAWTGSAADEPAPACDTAFEPCWRPLRRPPRPEPPLLRPPTLVVRAAGDDGDELLAELTRRGLVREHVELDADAEGAWDALGGQAPGSVLFLASRSCGAPQEAARARCAMAYLALARALLARGFAGEVLSVSRRLHAIGEQLPPSGVPLAALVEGLALGLRREAAGIDAWHLDLPGATGAGDGRALAAAAAVRRAEVAAAWRDDALHVRRLRAIPLPGGQPTGVALGACGIVATGALGGVGREMLAQLLGDGEPAARVLVVGRTPLDAPSAAGRRDALAQLAPRCRELRHRVVAAEDEAALRDAVAEAERDWGIPITVGLHLAGAFEERALAEVDADAWAAQVAGKADGLLNLARLLGERVGATLLVTSSVVADAGAARAAPYIAANRFAETCSETLRRRDGLDVRCVSWGAWRGVGISAGVALDAYIVRRGMLRHTPAEGRALTSWAWRQPPGVRVLGLSAAHARVRGALADGPVHPLEQLAVELPATAAAGAAPPLHDPWGRPLAQRTVGALPPPPAADGTPDGPEAAALAAVLGELLDGSAPPDRPFAELGLGSLELIKAHAGLERRLGRTIDRTLLFELPTARRVIERLVADAPAPRPTRDSLRELRDAIAIVGVALRFPSAHTPDEFWRLLSDGRCAVRRFEPHELIAAGVPADVVADPDFVPVTGSLDDVDRFAPEAFGMSVREAQLTAPQQRLLLEVVHELLVVSGYETQAQEASVGVFAGAGMHLYGLNTYLLSAVLGATDVRDPVTGLQVAIGNEADFTATRLAFRLGLTGPAVGVQTACSTALTAVHLARQSLLAGDCDAAIAATGAVHVPHPNGYLYREGSILSPSGSCRAFDARADGTVGGNGVAAVLLKPLAQARADGDAIHAVIRGSAVNNDGARKAGFTAPSMQGQHAVVARALAAAGARADEIAYVQAHGTGTPIGDPIEVQALTRAFGDGASRRGACVLGSVKPNIGHLDSCAGLAGLIAAMLVLEHGEAPPQINYETPNPDLRLDDGPFRIVREPTPLAPAGGAPLRAGVSALGVGGTNVHVVLEQAV